MQPLNPCSNCKSRKIVFDGIHWTCYGCGSPVTDPVKAEFDRIRALLEHHVSPETAELMMKEPE